MNCFAVIAFFACLAASNAGLHHGAHTNILQGPSSKTTIVGPEGSVISAVAPGGQIIHEEQPGVVAHAAPVLSHVAPAVSYASHSVSHHVPTVNHAGHAVAYVAAPLAHASHHAAPSTVVVHSSAYEHGSAGHSGIISTGHGYHATPVVAYVTHIDHGYGHEGQYAHDSLYNGGSYLSRGYHH